MDKPASYLFQQQREESTNKTGFFTRQEGNDLDAGKEAFKKLQEILAKHGIPSTIKEELLRCGCTDLSIVADKYVTDAEMKSVLSEAEKELKAPIRTFTIFNTDLDSIPLRSNLSNQELTDEYGMRFSPPALQGPEALKLHYDQSPPSREQTTSPTTPIINNEIVTPSISTGSRSPSDLAYADLDGNKKLDMCELQQLANTIMKPIQIYNRNNEAGSGVIIGDKTIFINETQTIQFAPDVKNPDANSHSLLFTLTPASTPNNASNVCAKSR